MDADKEEGGVFVCSRCGLSETYHYKGSKPPFCKQIVLLEDAYVRKDPFAPPKQRDFLLLGSDCTICHKPTCQSPECSLFYSKRFCLPCAQLNIDSFPEPVQQKLRKVCQGGAV